MGKPDSILLGYETQTSVSLYFVENTAKYIFYTLREA